MPVDFNGLTHFQYCLGLHCKPLEIAKLPPSCWASRSEGGQMSLIHALKWIYMNTKALCSDQSYISHNAVEKCGQTTALTWTSVTSN